MGHDGLSAAHVPLLCRQSFIIFDLLNFFIMQRVISMLYTLLAFAPLFVQSWRLIDNLDGNTWAQNTYFETVTHNNEYVTYLNKDAAVREGLVQNRNGQLYVGVDSWSHLDPNGPGRKSVRMRSNKSYNSGTLIIGDFAHMPANVCGTWPAFWTVGPSWPNDGEIDILEGVNEKAVNQVTLHTSPGCRPYVGPEGQTGVPAANPDCGAGGGFEGCGVINTRGSGYGNGFNGAGGGVYAVLWVGDSIKAWYFEPGRVPSDIYSGAPWPESWGMPVANWRGCDFGQLMKNQQIILNTAFCGNWAGAVWGAGSCAARAPSCNAYVASNPQAFSEAYWLVNSIKVYQ